MSRTRAAISFGGQASTSTKADGVGSETTPPAVGVTPGCKKGAKFEFERKKRNGQRLHSCK